MSSNAHNDSRSFWGTGFLATLLLICTCGIGYFVYVDLNPKRDFEGEYASFIARSNQALLSLKAEAVHVEAICAEMEKHEGADKHDLQALRTKEAELIRRIREGAVLLGGSTSPEIRDFLAEQKFR